MGKKREINDNRGLARGARLEQRGGMAKRCDQASPWPERRAPEAGAPAPDRAAKGVRLFPMAVISKLFAIMDRRVPSGYQDEHGFHYGNPSLVRQEPPAWPPEL